MVNTYMVTLPESEAGVAIGEVEDEGSTSGPDVWPLPLEEGLRWVAVGEE